MVRSTVKKIAFFPDTSQMFLGSAVKQTLFMKKTFWYEKVNILKEILNTEFDIPNAFKNSLSRPQKIRVRMVTRNKTLLPVW